MPRAEVHLIWKTLDPVSSDRGLSILPTTTFDDFPQLDVICVPGDPGQVALSRQVSRDERDRYAKYCLYCEIVELISGGRVGSASALHLSFRDHVHQLNAGQKDPGTAKILEAQHGPDAPLDRPMVLLDEVVEIFGLADLDRRFTISIDRFERGEIGTAFVDGHRLGYPILGDRFFKVPPGCSLVTMGAQQEVDGVAVLVHGAVEIFPVALDADVRVSRPWELRPKPLAEPYVTLARHTAAGSAGGISPPAAHRTVRKPLDLHGSS